ncbi:Thioredoxin [Dirofilaria immitis]
MVRNGFLPVLQGASTPTTPIETSNQFGINAMPTFVFFSNGREVDRIMSANVEMLETKIVQRLKETCKIIKLFKTDFFAWTDISKCELCGQNIEKSEDHVWYEIWIKDLNRWVHCKPYENIIYLFHIIKECTPLLCKKKLNIRYASFMEKLEVENELNGCLYQSKRKFMTKYSAINAPRSKAKTFVSRKPSGTSFITILFASPSTIAVFPTPGSPISTGLFFVRLSDTCIVLLISSSRPITGSMIGLIVMTVPSTVAIGNSLE